MVHFIVILDKLRKITVLSYAQKLLISSKSDSSACCVLISILFISWNNLCHRQNSNMFDKFTKLLKCMYMEILFNLTRKVSHVNVYFVIFVTNMYLINEFQS